MINHAHANFPRAGFLRRLGAIIYDSLLAIAVYMVAGAIGFGIFAALTSMQIISMEHYTMVADLLDKTPVYKSVYRLWIAFCVGLFYVLFWSYGGQTLGMRAWRLKIQQPNGHRLSMITASARLVWSLLGLGNLMILMGNDKLALQDKMTRSEVVVLSKEANQMRNWHGV